jgi:tetratricopeptide (TPR) repeat protein
MLPQASRTAGRIHLAMVATAALLGSAFGGLAAPYRPTDGPTVILTVSPASAAIKRALHDRGGQPGLRGMTLAAALDSARLAIRDGRREADPRRYGQAQAALGPWWSDPNCPLEARLLRAVIRQALHDFSGAVADLDAILDSDPDNAQARLSRAFVHQATGAIAAARHDCRNLPARVGRLAAAVCRGRIMALTGEGEAALDTIARAIAIDRTSDPEMRRWAAATAADIAVSLARSDAALHWFARAIDADADVPTLVDYADFLLDAGRPGEVIALLEHRKPGDMALLRLAIAAKAAGDPRATAWSALLSEGFALARATGNALHLREEARFTLEVLGDAQRAVDLALRNWAVQKEPADARVLLAAALAAERPRAVDAVVAFIAESGLEDARLTGLLDRLARIRRSGGLGSSGL